MQPVIRLDNVDVALGSKVILRDITWDLLPRQHWAIVGQNGSGKSTLLKLIRGELWPRPGRGRRIYFFDGSEQVGTAIGAKERISSVSPELQERYLQQEWRLTARDVVFSGFGNSDYVYTKPTAEQRSHVRAITALLRIEPLLSRDVQQLSTGELRKVLIARALASRPAILILDEVCDGLDVPSRRTLLRAIERIAATGTQLLFATHRADEIPSCITHVLAMQNGRALRQTRHDRPSRPATPIKSGFHATTTVRPGATLIRIQRANVYLERKRVLHDVSWQLRAGEHWAILGANGAGKSTFLKLIAGNVYPAIGGKVQRWDFGRRSTIWDVRRRIGFLSPELQANYRDNISAAEVIGSGFSSSIGLPKKLSQKQKLEVRDLMREFAATQLAEKRVGEMSYGEFRKILLLRALVHRPQLLLCDEPFDGLDAESRRAFRDALETAARSGAQLVIVTHHVEELPRCITNSMTLVAGRVAVP